MNTWGEGVGTVLRPSAAFFHSTNRSSCSAVSSGFLRSYWCSAPHRQVRTDAAVATVGVAPAEGVKCARCWHYSTTVGQSPTYAGVCDRCHAALAAMSFPPVNFLPLETEAESPQA